MVSAKNEEVNEEKEDASSHRGEIQYRRKRISRDLGGEVGWVVKGYPVGGGGLGTAVPQAEGAIG